MKIVELCFDYGVNVNVLKCSLGMVFYLVVFKGNFEMVELLIEWGVDVNLKDGDVKIFFYK